MPDFAKVFALLSDLETERLIIRKIEKKDVCDMFEYSQKESMTRWLLWEHHSSIETTKRYIEAVQRAYKANTFFELAVVYKENMKMIGTCGFAKIDEENRSAELGYVISEDYKGIGIATEASNAILRVGFVNMNLNRIYSRYMRENEASRRVMDKIGMEFEGMHRKELFVKGEYRDIGFCSITRDEYFAKGLDKTDVLMKPEKKFRLPFFENN